MAKLKIEDNVLIECIPEDEETDIVIPEGVEKIACKIPLFSTDVDVAGKVKSVTFPSTLKSWSTDTRLQWEDVLFDIPTIAFDGRNLSELTGKVIYCFGEKILTKDLYAKVRRESQDADSYYDQHDCWEEWDKHEAADMDYEYYNEMAEKVVTCLRCFLAREFDECKKMLEPEYRNEVDEIAFYMFLHCPKDGKLQAYSRDKILESFRTQALIMREWLEDDDLSEIFRPSTNQLITGKNIDEWIELASKEVKMAEEDEWAYEEVCEFLKMLEEYKHLLT